MFQFFSFLPLNSAVFDYGTRGRGKYATNLDGDVKIYIRALVVLISPLSGRRHGWDKWRRKKEKDKKEVRGKRREEERKRR